MARCGPFWSQGFKLVGFSQDGTGAATRTVQAKLREVAVSLADFRSGVDTTDTAAWHRVVTAGYRVIFLPAGQGLGDDGEYLIYTQSTGTGTPLRRAICRRGCACSAMAMGAPLFVRSIPGRRSFVR
jgi:hypothetical protein